MTPQSARSAERARVVAWLDHWAAVPGEGDFSAGWKTCAFNAAREIERGDHHPVSRSGIPLFRRTAK